MLTFKWLRNSNTGCCQTGKYRNSRFTRKRDVEDLPRNKRGASGIQCAINYPLTGGRLLMPQLFLLLLRGSSRNVAKARRSSLYASLYTILFSTLNPARFYARATSPSSRDSMRATWNAAASSRFHHFALARFLRVLDLTKGFKLEQIFHVPLCAVERSFCAINLQIDIYRVFRSRL